MLHTSPCHNLNPEPLDPISISGLFPFSLVEDQWPMGNSTTGVLQMEQKPHLIRKRMTSSVTSTNQTSQLERYKYNWDVKGSKNKKGLGQIPRKNIIAKILLRGFRCKVHQVGKLFIEFDEKFINWINYSSNLEKIFDEKFIKSITYSSNSINYSLK